MVNPVYQQDEELLLNPFGSRYLASGEYTDVNSNEFVVQEDTVISVLTGGDASISENSIDYKASMNLSGVTLKRGALIVAPVGEAFKSITIDSGSIMAYNCVVKGEKPGSFVGLLDLYPDAAAAYSLRKLRTAYVGSAIRVRRSSDNTEQDIGFVDNELDTTSLLAFVGAGDGFVTTWYDQSGLGNDISNASAGSQAKIVNAGSVVTLNSKPAFNSEGITTFNLSLSNTQLWTGNKSYSIFSAFRSSGVVSTQHLSSYVSGNPDTYRLAMLGGNNLRLQSYDNSGGSNLNSATISINTNFVVSIFRTQSTAQSFTNSVGGTEITGINPPSSPTVTSDFFYGGLASSFVFQGLSAEFIIYALDQSANREAIEDNINTHYTIY